MGFFDIFKPKWKHSDAEVRAEAVRELGDDQAALLAEIARTDSDARVRRIALKRISDAALLSQLAEHDPDESLRKAAGEKAAELLIAAACADGEEARCLQALERLSLPRALAQVAKQAVLPSVRERAVARLDDP